MSRKNMDMMREIRQWIKLVLNIFNEVKGARK